MNKVVWILASVAMLTYAAGDIAAKFFANTKSMVWGSIAMLGYMITTLLFLVAMDRFNSLSVVGTLWNVGYCLITIGLALLVFKESVTAVQIVGFILGVIAVWMMSPNH